MQVERKQVPIRGRKAKGALECRNKLSFWQGLIGSRSTSLFSCWETCFRLCALYHYLRYLHVGFSYNDLIEETEKRHRVDLQHSTRDLFVRLNSTDPVLYVFMFQVVFTKLTPPSSPDHIPQSVLSQKIYILLFFFAELLLQCLSHGIRRTG